MFHGDLTLEHNLLMLSSWTGDLIIFMLFHLSVSLPTKDRTGPINRTPPSSTLDNTTFVYISTETPNRPPPPASSVGQPSVPATQQSSSSPQQTPTHNGLQSIRESFQQRAISSKATNIILQSWSTGTKKQYAPYITN